VYAYVMLTNESMPRSRHLGLIGGLGVSAAVIYYKAITAGCVDRDKVPRMTLAHAHAPTALAHVTDGRIDALAEYLAGFVRELAAAGAELLAIPAVTPHIAIDLLRRQSPLPIVDMLQTTEQRLRDRNLSRVALFGTRFTIETEIFGALGSFEVVAPKHDEVDEIHRIYLELATDGRTSPANVEKLRRIARAIRTRDRVEAIVLAGTDLNVIFDEATAGFPAVDCAAAHIDAILDWM
jgi:aspartate racemase